MEDHTKRNYRIICYPKRRSVSFEQSLEDEDLWYASSINDFKLRVHFDSSKPVVKEFLAIVEACLVKTPRPRRKKDRKILNYILSSGVFDIQYSHAVSHLFFLKLITREESVQYHKMLESCDKESEVLAETLISTEFKKHFEK